MFIRETSAGEQAPDGVHAGVIADVQELGVMQNAFGKEQEKLRVVILIDTRDAAGSPIRVTQLLTASLHPKGKLYPLVMAALGALPSGGGLDTEELVGKQVCITTSQQENRNGSMFANILSVKPPKPGQAPVAIPLGYQRQKDRAKQPPGKAPPAKQRR